MGFENSKELYLKRNSLSYFPHVAIVSKHDTSQSQPEFSYFSIDGDSEEISEAPIKHQVKPEPSLTTTTIATAPITIPYASRTEGVTKRLDSTNTESVISNESESPS
ncbi:unnamed protein product, partial [Rotaria magnacalcarata]